MQEMHAANALRQTRRHTKQTSVPFLLSSTWAEQTCSRLTAFTLLGFCESQNCKGTLRHWLQAPAPRAIALHPCYSLQIFLKPHPGSLQKGRGHNVISQCSDHHHLHEVFPNILSRFPPLQFIHIFSCSFWCQIHCKLKLSYNETVAN